MGPVPLGASKLFATFVKFYRISSRIGLPFRHRPRGSRWCRRPKDASCPANMGNPEPHWPTRLVGVVLGTVRIPKNIVGDLFAWFWLTWDYEGGAPLRASFQARDPWFPRTPWLLGGPALRSQAAHLDDSWPLHNGSPPEIIFIHPS